MGSDYEAIRAQNILDYGRKTSHLDLFRQLYADRTHFIYELLQNAEDAGARRIRFSLHPDRLEVNHNGRPFTTHDVRAICGVGVGTKTDELTQIGRFGIGFKSVFAYTDTPHIYSRKERFLIRDFVRPEEAPGRKDGADDTLFVFPFNRDEPSAEAAREEVASGLLRLHGDVLLFLRSLRKISVEIDGEQIIRLERKHRKSIVTLVTSNSNGTEKEKWRVFSAGTAGDVDDPLVEIAFLLDDGAVVRDPRPQLAAYFPTDKPTGLRFRVQGPYRTTPARDNVPTDDEWNRFLVGKTALLMASALMRLRDEDTLDLDVLRVMPFDEDDTPEGSMFHPVFEAVLAAMSEESLIRIEGGGFARAETVRLGRSAALRRLLDASQLADLVGSSELVYWVDGRITAESESRIHSYLTEDLEIPELTSRGVVLEMKRKWLESQSTDWMIEFYHFLSDQRRLWTRWNDPLRSTKFVRLEDGRHVRPDKAFLPPVGESAFPIVDREIAADEKALEFLKALGLKQPDAVDDLIRRVVGKYGSDRYRLDVDELNTGDLDAIRTLLREVSGSQRIRLLGAVGGKPVFRALQETRGHAEYRSASQILSRNAVTRMWFEGNDEVWWLDDAYGLTAEEIEAFRIETGVAVRKRVARYQGFVELADWWGHHERGLRGFDPDAKISGLAHVLKHPSFERARYLWNEILGRDPLLVSGEVETATHQDYSNANTKVVVSEIGEMLRTSAWLPSTGGFVNPADLSLDDLPEGFDRNHDLADRLGMRSTTVDDLAREHGMAPDDLQWILSHPEELARLRSETRVEQPAGERHEDDRVGAEDDPAEGGGKTTSGEALDRGRRSKPPGAAGQKAGAARSSGGAAGTAGELVAPVSTDRSSSSESTKSKGAELDASGEPSGGDRGPRVTYLAASKPQTTAGDASEEHRRVERIGIDTVINIEVGEGRQSEEMPLNNPGYDIKSTDGDEVRYIEVKALSGEWGESGVALTATEYEYAVEHGADYWLYVVERCDAERRVTMIRNPGKKPTQFVYDAGWRDLPEEERLQP